MRPRPKKEELLQLRETRSVESSRVGRVVAFEDGRVRVDFEGNPGPPLLARVSSTLEEGALRAAARDQQEAVLLFDRDDPRRPLLVALLRSESPLVDGMLSGPLPPGPKVLRVDEKRVLISGQEEVVLQCGKASLTLRRDGRVVLRGVNVVTQAEQVQKIRGGKVQIN